VEVVELSVMKLSWATLFWARLFWARAPTETRSERKSAASRIMDGGPVNPATGAATAREYRAGVRDASECARVRLLLDKARDAASLRPQGAPCFHQATGSKP
jgi:hypothetical protein